MCVVCTCLCVACAKVIEPCRSAAWTQSDVQAFFQAYIEAGSRPSTLFSRSAHVLYLFVNLHCSVFGYQRCFHVSTTFFIITSHSSVAFPAQSQCSTIKCDLRRHSILPGWLGSHGMMCRGKIFLVLSFGKRTRGKYVYFLYITEFP